MTEIRQKILPDVGTLLSQVRFFRRYFFFVGKFSLLKCGGLYQRDFGAGGGGSPRLSPYNAVTSFSEAIKTHTFFCNSGCPQEYVKIDD